MLAAPKPVRSVSEVGSDPPPGRAFDDVLTLATKVTGCPIAWIVFFDGERRWVKASVGIEAARIRGASSLCNSSFEREVVEVPDLREDPRWVDHPLVRGEPRLRHFAAASISTRGGRVLGALCVSDRAARALDGSAKLALEILARRISDHFELSSAHGALADRHRELQRLQHNQADELAGAERVLQQMIRRGVLDSVGIRYNITASSLFNGDILLAARTPRGALRIMIGDFTGHGLSAALGTLPTSSVFHAMTAKGVGPDALAAELNSKLYGSLPTGMFLACAIAEVDCAKRTLRVLNCGMPDPLVWRSGEGVVHRFVSTGLPLGIVDRTKADFCAETIAFGPADRFLAYSDGLIEATNERDDPFGEERLVALLGEPREPATVFDALIEAVGRFSGFPSAASFEDDLTVIELDCAATVDPEPENEELVQAEPQLVSVPAWSMTMELGPSELRNFDAMGTIEALMDRLTCVREHVALIGTVVVELFTNGLDHGLLGLDSRIKDSVDGFSAYLDQKSRRLTLLREGTIRLGLAHVPDGRGGGALHIEVRDTGPGFDVNALPAPGAPHSKLYGRGIPLVRDLCDRLEYRGKGNEVLAIYTWLAEDVRPTA